MIIIKNNIIPFKGFSAISLFGFIFIRKEAVITDRMINHEKIHFFQQLELLFVLFFIFYLIEFVIKLFIYKNFKIAYLNISFEREAYLNDNDYWYLNNRKLFNFIKYI